MIKNKYLKFKINFVFIFIEKTLSIMVLVSVWHGLWGSSPSIPISSLCMMHMISRLLSQCNGIPHAIMWLLWVSNSTLQLRLSTLSQYNIITTCVGIQGFINGGKVVVFGDMFSFWAGNCVSRYIVSLCTHHKRHTQI